jgi:hypothetical protein
MTSLLRDCVSWLEGSLLFSRFVQAVTVQRWRCDDGDDGVKAAVVKEYYFMRCTNATAIQAARKKVTIDKSWKKAGRSSVTNMLSSLFSQGVNPVEEVCLTARVVHRSGVLVLTPTDTTERRCVPSDHPWLRFQEGTSKGAEGEEVELEMLSSWMMTCLQGAPGARNLALKAPYKPLGILPYISIAAKVMSFDDIDACLAAPERKLSRRVYCGAGMLTESASGLPFHLDGSFVMDMARRGVVSIPAELSSRQQPHQPASQIMSVALQQQWNSTLLTACLDTLLPATLLRLKDDMLAKNEEEGGVSSELKRFYFYWPFLSSMSREMAFTALHQSTLFTQLAQASLFMGRRKFEALSNVIIPLTPNPSSVSGCFVIYYC